MHSTGTAQRIEKKNYQQKMNKNIGLEKCMNIIFTRLSIWNDEIIKKGIIISKKWHFEKKLLLFVKKLLKGEKNEILTSLQF